MKRWALLLEMALLLGVIAAVIVLRSPYAPSVGPMRGIEEVWAIEDMRQESETPLVTRMENFGVPLGYDRESNTFYCTLGLDNGDTWPEIKLTLPQANGVSVCFVDDYSYDWCSDAIREGYAYELMAYNDTHYSYFYLVFTGLPIVTIHADAPVDWADEEATVTVGRVGEAAQGEALVHRRGAGSAAISDKKSYSVKFARSRDRRNVFVDVPMLGVTDRFVLLSGAADPSLLRDRLSWQMYAHLADGSESFGARQTQYVEVFENDEYVGTHIMMTPVDIGEELRKTSEEAALTDTVYRSTCTDYPGDKPCVKNVTCDISGYELFYQAGTGAPFDQLEAYMALEQETDDARFAEMAQKIIDTESIIRQYLFVQAGAMSDNVYNNMYIWAHRTQDGVRYRFAPWDMDLTWGRYRDPETGELYHDLFTFSVAQRMLELDVGDARKRWRRSGGRCAAARSTLKPWNRTSGSMPASSRIPAHTCATAISGAWNTSTPMRTA